MIKHLNVNITEDENDTENEAITSEQFHHSQKTTDNFQEMFYSVRVTDTEKSAKGGSQVSDQELRDTSTGSCRVQYSTGCRNNSLSDTLWSELVTNDHLLLLGTMLLNLIFGFNHIFYYTPRHITVRLLFSYLEFVSIFQRISRKTFFFNPFSVIHTRPIIH
jgi:hypothetical protein